MRKFNLLAFTCCFFLASCGGDDRETLVVYTPHGKELLQHYEDAFEAEYIDVDVQWLDMGAQQVYDRIRTESVRPQASLWWGGPNIDFDLAADEGLLAPYRPTWHEAVGEEAKHAQDLWYATYMTPEVIMYNSDAISREDVATDWDDLLDPKWADRIIVRYPLASGTMRTIFAAMILRQPDVEEGYAWLARLDMNTRMYAADPTQLYVSTARGMGDITLWNMPDTEIQHNEHGYPFAFVVPESGTPIITEGIALVKDAPNPERAKAFYEYVTTREALLYQAKTNYRIPARQDIPAEELPKWISSVELVPMPMDWDRLADESASWLQFWDENIKGRGEEYLNETLMR